MKDLFLIPYVSPRMFEIWIHIAVVSGCW